MSRSLERELVPHRSGFISVGALCQQGGRMFSSLLVKGIASREASVLKVKRLIMRGRVPHLCSTKAFGCHGWALRTIVFRMVSNFRMHAVITTLNGFPARWSRWAKSRRRGLHRLAVRAAMYRARLTSPRPPRIRRWPRYRPLSWLMGARPTSEAISCRLSRPNSGSSATRVELVVEPTPGTLSMRSRFARQSSSDSISLATALSIAAICWSNTFRTRSIVRLADLTVDWCLRVRSMARSAISCRLRVTKAFNSSCFSEVLGVVRGRTCWANKASTCASISSVFASRPRALAKSRTCLGFTTATAQPASMSSATSWRSYPPVASTTTKVSSGEPSCFCSRSEALSLTRIVNDRLSGRRWTSHEDLDTSMPTNRVAVNLAVSSINKPHSCGCELPALREQPLWRLFGLITQGQRRSSFSTASKLAPRGIRSAVGLDRWSSKACPIDCSIVQEIPGMCKQLKGWWWIKPLRRRPRIGPSPRRLRADVRAEARGAAPSVEPERRSIVSANVVTTENIQEEPVLAAAGGAFMDRALQMLRRLFALDGWCGIGSAVRRLWGIMTRRLNSSLRSHRTWWSSCRHVCSGLNKTMFASVGPNSRCRGHQEANPAEPGSSLEEKRSLRAE